MASPSPNTVPETPSRNQENSAANPIPLHLQPPPRLMARTVLQNIARADGTNSRMPGQLYTPSPPWSKISIDAPPLNPVDHKETSFRMIYHDMKTCLEKFTDRFNPLISGLEQTFSEIKSSGKLLETSHEKAVADMVDVVNRSQNMIVDSIKSQQSSIDTLHSELKIIANNYSTMSSFQDQHLQSFKELIELDHAHSRSIDSLTQLYQSQAQVLLTLQQQQYDIMTKLAPLEAKLDTYAVKIDKLDERLAPVDAASVMRTRDHSAKSTHIANNEVPENDFAEPKATAHLDTRHQSISSVYSSSKRLHAITPHRRMPSPRLNATIALKRKGSVVSNTLANTGKMTQVFTDTTNTNRKHSLRHSTKSPSPFPSNSRTIESRNNSPSTISQNSSHNAVTINQSVYHDHLTPKPHQSGLLTGPSSRYRSQSIPRSSSSPKLGNAFDAGLQVAPSDAFTYDDELASTVKESSVDRCLPKSKKARRILIDAGGADIDTDSSQADLFQFESF